MTKQKGKILYCFHITIDYITQTHVPVEKLLNFCVYLKMLVSIRTKTDCL